jgi:hypothetical protein
MKVGRVSDVIEPAGWVQMAVRFRDSPAPRIHEKRRGVRLNSRVPVSIEWEDTADGVLREEAITRVVSPYGCLVVLSKELSMEQHLVVLNVATQENIPGVVVWKGKERSEGWELGIELVQPPHDFWGLGL